MGIRRDLLSQWAHKDREAGVPVAVVQAAMEALKPLAEARFPPSNAQCPRCGGRAMQLLVTVQCMRTGGCRTLDERVVCAPEPMFVAADPTYPGRRLIEDFWTIPDASTFSDGHEGDRIRPTLVHPTREGVLALWRAREVAEEARNG